jgi:hypothetical protein
LVASAFSGDIKKYGINKILEKTMPDIIDLENNGLKVNDKLYRGSVAQISADNLGIHQIFNLKCSFINENICHLCNASTSTIQDNFNAKKFTAKTIFINNQLTNGKIYFHIY